MVWQRTIWAPLHVVDANATLGLRLRGAGRGPEGVAVRLPALFVEDEEVALGPNCAESRALAAPPRQDAPISELAGSELEQLLHAVGLATSRLVFLNGQADSCLVRSLSAHRHRREASTNARTEVLHARPQAPIHRELQELLSALAAFVAARVSDGRLTVRHAAADAILGICEATSPALSRACAHCILCPRGVQVATGPTCTRRQVASRRRSNPIGHVPMCRAWLLTVC